MPKVLINDATLRDGSHAVGHQLSSHQIAVLLDSSRCVMLGRCAKDFINIISRIVLQAGEIEMHKKIWHQGMEISYFDSWGRLLSRAGKYKKSSGAKKERLHRSGPIRSVHRIDRETSGLLVFARTVPAGRILAEQFRQHTTQRKYLALADDIMAMDFSK